MTRDCATVAEFFNTIHGMGMDPDMSWGPLPGDAITFRGETIRYMPKPKDEAREAFEAALAKMPGRFTVLQGVTLGNHMRPEPPTEEDLFALFLAGRVSAKPGPSVPSHPALDRAWNAAIEAAALECVCCNSNAVMVRKLLRDVPK